jgi:hypothetical protein
MRATYDPIPDCFTEEAEAEPSGIEIILSYRTKHHRRNGCQRAADEQVANKL